MRAWFCLPLLLSCADTAISFAVPSVPILGSLSAVTPRQRYSNDRWPISCAGMSFAIPAMFRTKKEKLCKAANNAPLDDSIVLSKIGDQEAVHEATAAVMICDNYEEWFQPGAAKYKGFCVQRPNLLPNLELQQIVDSIPEEDFRVERINVVGKSEKDLTLALQRAADHLLATERTETKDELRMGAFLAEQPMVKDQIRMDVIDIATAMARLLPKATHLDLKLETFGNNVCSAWHKDNYWARSIVTYVGKAATMYVEDDGVNLDALEEQRPSEERIKGSEWVRSVGVGDVLMIQGSLYPNATHSSPGLVHKSPVPIRNADGSIVQRLCLKVDCGMPYSPWAS